MSTHNIGFYEDLTKIIFELSSNIMKYAPYFLIIIIIIIIMTLLAHLSRRLIGELIVYPWSGVRRRRPSSVAHNAQTSSSQKPLGRSKPNFMWSLLG